MIIEIEEYFKCSLPKEYAAFISQHNSEMEGDVYLYLLEDLVERNECYETKEYAPGYINIGNDGGGMAFIIKLDESNPAVYAVDHGSMDPEESQLVCRGFREWWTSEFKYHD